MNKENAILLINSSFHPSIGGVENSLKSLAKELTRAGSNVVVVAGDRSNSTDEKLVSEEVLYGAKVYRYRLAPCFLYFFTCILTLFKLKKMYCFDYVISRNNFTTICCLLAGFKNVKYLAPGVYRFQNALSNSSKKNIKSIISFYINCMLESLNFFLLKKIYVFSDEMKRQVMAINGSLDVVKVFPGIDSERFGIPSCEEIRNLRIKYGLPLDKKILLFLGRLEKVKNPGFALNIIENLDDDHFLLVVGDGSCKEGLLKYVSDKGLCERVLFRAFTNSPEDYFKLSDLFLMISTYEPLGQVTLEALTCGVPVVAFSKSEAINTATEEVFDAFGVLRKEEYFFNQSDDVRKVASLIERITSEQHDFGVGKVDFSWIETFKNICCD